MQNEAIKIKELHYKITKHKAERLEKSLKN